MGDFSRYIPHTEADCRAMLEAIGVKRVEDLFEAIPEKYRLTEPLRLPEPLSEPDLLRSLAGPPISRCSRGRLEPFSRRGGLPSLHPVGRLQSDFPIGVLYSLYALSTGDQPGDPSGHLRVSDADVPADRDGGFKRIDVRRRIRPGRGCFDVPAHHKAEEDPSLPGRAS